MNIHWLTVVKKRTSIFAESSYLRTPIHAVFTNSDSFNEIKSVASICGIRPKYGWDDDLFMETKCERCLKIIDKMDKIT